MLLLPIVSWSDLGTSIVRGPDVLSRAAFSSWYGRVLVQQPVHVVKDEQVAGAGVVAQLAEHIGRAEPVVLAPVIVDGGPFCLEPVDGALDSLAFADATGARNDEPGEGFELGVADYLDPALKVLERLGLLFDPVSSSTGR
jgi:hypothetical protein